MVAGIFALILIDNTMSNARHKVKVVWVYVTLRKVKNTVLEKFLPF